MASLKKIDKELISCLSEDLPKNVIGAAVLVGEDNSVFHAGIFIRYNGSSKLLHYTGELIKLDEFRAGRNYYFKKLDFINPELASSFLTQSRLVIKESNVKYGYFYLGSFFDGTGKFVNSGDMPEYMTCVGFCLNFIKYFIRKDDFIEYMDWDIEIEGTDFADDFIKEKVLPYYPDIDINAFKAGMRRIWPIEYISASFNKGIPVRKEFVDKTVPKVKKIVEKKVA